MSSELPAIRAIFRIPPEVWGLIVAFARTPYSGQTTQHGELLLPTDWHATQQLWRDTYGDERLLSTECLTRAPPEARCLSRQTPICSQHCGRMLLNPNDIVPSIISLSQINRQLRHAAFVLSECWASIALAIPARFEDVLERSGTERPLDFVACTGICMHVIRQIMPHVQRAIRFQTSLPSLCKEHPSHLTALYMEERLTNARQLQELELYFDGGRVPFMVLCEPRRLSSVRTVRLQNSPILFWGPHLTELDIATEMPEWTFGPKTLLDILQHCPGMQYLTIQRALVQDEDYMWAQPFDVRRPVIALKELRMLWCDCLQYELVNLLYALDVPSATNIHFGYYGVMSTQDRQGFADTQIQVGFTLMSSAEPHRAREIVESVIHDSDDDNEAEGIEVQSNLPLQHDGRTTPLYGQSSSIQQWARDVAVEQSLVQTGEDGRVLTNVRLCDTPAGDRHPLPWSTATTIGLDVGVAGHDNRVPVHCADFFTIVNSVDAGDVRQFLERAFHPRYFGLRPMRWVTLHNRDLLLGRHPSRELLPSESLEAEAGLMQHFSQYMGTDNINHVIIGRRSWIPHEVMDWYQLLQWFPTLERLDIDADVREVDPVTALVDYLAYPDFHPSLRIINLSRYDGDYEALRNAVEEVGAVGRDVAIAWTLNPT